MSRMSKLIAIGVLLSMSVAAAVKIEKVSYAGWPNCYKMSNGEVELIVSTDVGPRVLRYGFVGGQNLFAEFKEEQGKTGEKVWVGRGGHRLWMAPETKPDTYALDNSTVKAAIKGNSIELTAPVEKETGLEKVIILKLADKGGEVEVTHRIHNMSGKVKRLAPWALTMMAPGGTAISGFPARGSHADNLLPTNPLTMWAYTDFTDKRWTLTKKYIVLRQDVKVSAPQKVALFNKDTFAAYLLGGDLFIKRYTADPSKTYPDFGCSFEMFTNERFLELETVGPLADVQAGAGVQHVERWSLHKDVKIPSLKTGANEAEIDKVLLPLLAR